MKNIEILIIGGGPAGLFAAMAAANLGAKVLVCERDDTLGGQLIKQTGKFFGDEHASMRGFVIAKEMIADVEQAANIEVWLDTTILGIYSDGIVTCEHEGQHVKIKAERIIIATGAAENFLAFPGNDLPGVYAAGALETLMHSSGIKPADRVLMVGAGNIGLTISYQLKQAGVEVPAVIEALPRIGGYLVHASKLARTGTAIKTGYTIKEAYGNGQVEGAIIVALDQNMQQIEGTEEDIKCDTIALAVGLSPLAELLWQAGCEMLFVKELGGHVPVVDRYMETSIANLYVAGDVCGLEEATTAMMEGRIVGLSAAATLAYLPEEAAKLQVEAAEQLCSLRSGPLCERVRTGLGKIKDKRGA